MRMYRMLKEVGKLVSPVRMRHAPNLRLLCSVKGYARICATCFPSSTSEQQVSRRWTPRVYQDILRTIIQKFGPRPTSSVSIMAQGEASSVTSEFYCEFWGNCCFSYSPSRWSLVNLPESSGFCFFILSKFLDLMLVHPVHPKGETRNK